MKTFFIDGCSSLEGFWPPFGWMNLLRIMNRSYVKLLPIETLLKSFEREVTGKSHVVFGSH